MSVYSSSESSTVNKRSIVSCDEGVRVFCDNRCILGEGPAWDASLQSLFWVDIHGGKVFAATLDRREIRSWTVNSQPSAIIIAQDGGILVPANQEILHLCIESGDLQRVASLIGEPSGNRCNDAKCDPNGNLWIGTMDSEAKLRTGQLWQFIVGYGARVILDGIGIANTLAWDLARGRFYFADSMVGDIYKFEYKKETDEICSRDVFFRRDDAPGIPDGSAIDEEGFLWNARWDGGCVIRISPDGQLDRMIELPAKRPTSCAFGGPDMKTLFITSAMPDSRAVDGQDTYDGAVFSVDVDMAGDLVPPYNGPIGNDLARSKSR